MKSVRILVGLVSCLFIAATAYVDRAAADEAIGSQVVPALPHTGFSRIDEDPDGVYQCHVLMAVNNSEQNIDEDFQVPRNAGSHGGKGLNFSNSDNSYSLVLLADGKWMGISWWQGETLIGESLFVIAPGESEYRIAIMYNPKDQSEQVSLDCNLL